MNTDPQNPQGGHDVPLTPPPAAPASDALPAATAAQEPRAQEPRASGGSGAKAGVIAIAAFGGIALLGTGGTAAFAAVHDVSARASSISGDTQTVSVDGVEGLDLDVAASDVTARFGDVDEATLEVTGNRGGNWMLDREGDDLVVRSPDSAFGWLDGRWFGGGWFDGEEVVVLTLPESLNDGSLDADFSLSAGSLDIQGMFNEVDIDMGAGALSMEGSATSIDAEISAGRADLDLFDVTEAEFSVSAGKLVAELAETAPRSISIDVSAGSLELTVPDEVYNVSQDVSAGSLDNRLDTSGSSRYQIDASVSAGSAILRAAD